MKTDLPCGIVADLLPSYVDGLTGQESSDAVAAHLAHCERCRARYEAMKGGPQAVPAAQAPAVDWLTAANRKMLRWTAAAAIAMALLIFAVLGVRTYVIGRDAHGEALDWAVHSYADTVEVNVRPAETRLYRLTGGWVQEADGVLRFQGRLVRKLPWARHSTNANGYTTNNAGALQEIYVADALVWADGLPVSQESRDLYAVCTPYVGDPSALNRIAGVLLYDDVGFFETELQTAQRPYGWTLHFEASSAGTGLDAQSAARLDRRMGERAVQLLAVVGNLDVVSWTYTDETGTLRTRSLTLEAADAMLPELTARYNARCGADWEALPSVKDYAASPATLQQLVDLLGMPH